MLRCAVRIGILVDSAGKLRMLLCVCVCAVQPIIKFGVARRRASSILDLFREIQLTGSPAADREIERELTLSSSSTPP